MKKTYTLYLVKIHGDLVDIIIFLIAILLIIISNNNVPSGLAPDLLRWSGCWSNKNCYAVMLKIWRINTCNKLIKFVGNL